MAGVDFPIRAIRQQVSRALDLVVQIERFSDGSRKLTSITEVQRMEGDTVTLQDIFEYKYDKAHTEGGGSMVYTGLRPTCNKFERHGVALPKWMESHQFGAAPLVAAARGGLPARGSRRTIAVSADDQSDRNILPVQHARSRRSGPASSSLIAVAVLLAVTRRTDVSKRVGEFVSGPAVSRCAIADRASAGRQGVAFHFALAVLHRSKLELEVAEAPVGLDQLLAALIIITLLIGYLVVTEVKSPLAAPLALLVPVGAYFLVRMKADKQRRNFSEQLPDNLQVIASAMRAGQTFVGALQAVVDDAPEPSARELKRAVTDEALGVPLNDALTQVTERMNSEDFQHVAIVAGLQRDTGGNTAEVIDLVAETIRGRIEIRRLVRGLTAQGAWPDSSCPVCQPACF